MFKKINTVLLAAVTAVTIVAPGCKKGTFDINSPNPNVPSSVEPKFILSSALASTASLVAGNPGGGSQSGNDLFNIYMGYWAVSGDYIPSAALLQYKLTTDFGSSIWDQAYPTLKNFQSIETFYEGDKGANYSAIGKIMQALIFQRLVDIYNNVPYTAALNGGVNNSPAYDDASAVYKSLVAKLDSAVLLINAAPTTAENPAGNDIMFGGDMTQWLMFANTLKLKILMNLTQTSDGPAFIQSELSGLTPADFIGPDQDATINPGYANDANNHQSPLWQDIGSNTTGTAYGNNNYFRATSYAVSFYQNTGDPRVGEFYSPNAAGNIQGRQFGSTALEHNSDISGIGGPSKGKTPTTEGVLKSPSQPALILSATESLFLQAEAAERGYLSGATSSDLFKAAVTESFKYLEANYDPIRTADNTADSITFTPETSAERFYSQANDKVNIDISTNKIQTIILQKWAALNTIDPLAAWDDWRRLGIPSDLPISIYPGTTATHIPYRLPYPTSEYNYNAANTNQQGTIDPLSSKIFWMP